MREIKFRGKNSTGLVIGSLIVNPCYTAIIEIEDPDDGTSVRHFVIPDTVGQYTGLKDSEGREIYEGAGSWECVREDYHFLFIMRYIDLMTVIGNIHDNPELLEVEA